MNENVGNKMQSLLMRSLNTIKKHIIYQEASRKIRDKIKNIVLPLQLSSAIRKHISVSFSLFVKKKKQTLTYIFQFGFVFVIFLHINDREKLKLK